MEFGPDFWSQLIIQVPLLVLFAWYVRDLRKQEAEERKQRDERVAEEREKRDTEWKAFLSARDDQWKLLLEQIQQTTATIGATTAAQLEAVARQMEAVTKQMYAVQVSVAQFQTAQDCAVDEMRAYAGLREKLGTKPLEGG